MTLHETTELASKHKAAYLVELERRMFELLVIVECEDPSPTAIVTGGGILNEVELTFVD